MFLFSSVNLTALSAESITVISVRLSEKWDFSTANPELCNENHANVISQILNKSLRKVGTPTLSIDKESQFY